MKAKVTASTLLMVACLSGCATNGSQRELTGAAAGAAVGGATGIAVGGPSIGLQGAILGGVVGAAVGGLVKGPIIKKRQYYRDTRGYCYWMDRDGTAHYDQTVKC